MFQTLIINAVFRLLQSKLIDRISYSPLKDYLVKLLTPFKEVATILTDKNPENKKQLKEFWEDNKTQLIGHNLDTAISIIGKEVDDDNIKTIIIELLEGVKIDQGQIPQ